MTTARPNDLLQDARNGVARAFTLVEIMVTVALLSIIILGLVAMFNQTRRAFTSSLAQVDVLESGRGAADMIARDLEQMAPCYYSNAVNFDVGWGNYASIPTQMASPSDVWTNIIEELYFLTPSPVSNNQWNAVGYRLMPTDEANGVGSLYRFYLQGLTITNSPTTPAANGYVMNLATTLNGVGGSPTFFNTAFNSVPPNNFSRIIDGVTYFRVLAYKTNGVLITNGTFNLFKTIQARGGRYPGLDYSYYFSSNAVPAYVEIELGILETQAYEKYRSFVPGTQAADNYLTSHPGVVHIFRQRVPIRNVDPATAYQ
jgi:prepilin-type N-terminal cleavage/methylation domain-containing protein